MIEVKNYEDLNFVKKFNLIEDIRKETFNFQVKLLPITRFRFNIIKFILSRYLKNLQN